MNQRTLPTAKPQGRPRVAGLMPQDFSTAAVVVCRDLSSCLCWYLEPVLSTLRPWIYHYLSRQGAALQNKLLLSESASERRCLFMFMQRQQQQHDGDTMSSKTANNTTPHRPQIWNITGRKIGSQVVLVTPGNMDKSVDRKIRVLGVWYVLLAGLEDVETQRRGFCFVVATNTFKFGQVRHSPQTRCGFQLFPTIGPADLLCFDASSMLCGYANSYLHHCCRHTRGLGSWWH